MRLLQVCNVGNIVGGTAACAWSVTRALPDMDHVVVFRSRPTEATQAAFRECQVRQESQLALDSVLSVDVVLLHNTAKQHVSWSDAGDLPSRPVVQYIHSNARGHASAHRMVCCSEYLRERIDQPECTVLHQGVPLAPSMTEERSGEPFTIGRICTPTARKWPPRLLSFYETLASRHRDVHWEFVGCPEELRERMVAACNGRVQFHVAGTEARSLLHKWDAMLYHHPDLPETFGRTVAEAMRCGCVPIVDAAGGFREQVDGSDGFLCSSVDEFSEAIETLGDKSRRDERAKRCRRHADERFSLGAFRKRLLMLLETL